MFFKVTISSRDLIVLKKTVEFLRVLSWKSLRGVVVNALNCGIVASNFELPSFYNIQLIITKPIFWTE